MIEKVNPSHPDKIADRIAGAIVDYAYTQQENPKIAVEILIGHEKAYIIAETSIKIPINIINKIIKRIANITDIKYIEVPQDLLLSNNQYGQIKAGDNGIFKGVPINEEVKNLSNIARDIYKQYPTDGKYILAKNRLIICQSNAKEKELLKLLPNNLDIIINPLGYWIGGLNTDTGATNRKLGSDMGEAVTGGGLHGKDLSKADVSVNIYAHILANKTGNITSLSCAIGDKKINGIDYVEIVNIAKDYINAIGGFEKLAEWGIT
jgi:S-adenosylmethionine synthetase